MAISFEKAYLPILRGAMLGRRDWISKLNTGGEISGEISQSGSCGITYIASTTAADVVDGTMVTDATTTTTVNGTYVDKQVTMSLLPSQKAILRKASFIRQIAQKQGDALVQAMQNSAIADLKAGTALSGAAATLSTGQIDFHSESTAEAMENLEKMAGVVSLMFGNFAAYRPDEFAIVMAPAAWANFVSLKAVNMPSPQLMETSGMYVFMGVPVFMLAGATSFGGASLECAFVTCMESVLLALTEPELLNGGPYVASDACTKLTTIGPYAHGIVNSFFGEVINPAS